MHIDVLVKIKDGQNELYPRSLAEDVLLEFVNEKIDYFNDRTMIPYTYEKLKNNLNRIEPTLSAYIDEHGKWISEPSLRELNEALLNSNRDDMFYIIDCHI